MFRYAVTIFLSAFLLFQVQPLIGKFILPWYGGSPAVWTTCLLFFQAALLGGYSYAHFLTSKVPPRGQMLIHLALLAASLYFLPIAPKPEIWKPQASGQPVGQILMLLLATIGLPYFLLSTTGPLLQESYRRETGHPPYRLYSLSNIGSLLALLTYPFVFEPTFRLREQILGWSWGYGLFVAFCGWCALSFAKPARYPASAAETSTATGTSVDPTWREFVLWLALSACGSAMLMATTNQLCQEISSVPFLWVFPLALYLLSFIICFDHERWYHRHVFLGLLAVTVLGAMYAMWEGPSLEIWKQLAIYCSTLWVACMICHGELVRIRPVAHHATLFYLMVSAGGVLGGLLVAVVAPWALRDVWEYQIVLVTVIVLAFITAIRPQATPAALKPPDPTERLITAGALGLGLLMTVSWLVWMNQPDPNSPKKRLATMRNFYGVLYVTERHDPPDDGGARRTLVHGRIQHGVQFQEPERRYRPTTYFGHPSGVGLTLDNHPRRGSGPLNIGIVGLGCGTLAVYGRAGDTMTFYEINPQVIEIADEFFTYCKDSKADVKTIEGDARIVMERERAEQKEPKYDILIIDAFSSDAIPMHLLTKESVELFRDRLKPDGILCMHITNRFLNLTGVVRGIAKELGLECVLVDSAWNEELGLKRAKWAILTANKEFLDLPQIKDAIRPWDDKDPAPIVWTDDYGSMWQALSSD